MRSHLALVTLGVLLLGLVLARAPVTSWAAETGPLVATVEIFEPLVITPTSQLDFGNVVPPSPGFIQTFGVWRDDTSTVVDPGDGSFVSGQHKGTFDITGTAQESFLMGTSTSGCNKFGIGWNIVTARPSSGTLNASGFQSGTIEGAITINGSDVTPGPGECSYTINASYL